jgi:O-antigen ligase
MIILSNGEFLKIIFSFSLGAFGITSAYWANTLGLPVELSTWGGEREGFLRLGGVRADSVMVWPPILVAFGGFLGIIISKIYELNNIDRKTKKFFYLLLLLSALLIPPLIATMTHGGVGGVSIMFSIIVFLFFKLYNKNSINSSSRVIIRHIFFSIFLIFITVSTFNLFGITSRVNALEMFYEEQSEEMGAVGSRTDVWETAINTIKKYPFFGVPANVKEEIPKQYQDLGYYLSHNVFLDVGRQSGIIGIILYAIFFFWNIIYLYKNNYFIFAPFLLIHLAFLIFWMSLSFGNYKTFWIFWFITFMVKKTHMNIN